TAEPDPDVDARPIGFKSKPGEPERSRPSDLCEDGARTKAYFKRFQVKYKRRRDGGVDIPHSDQRFAGFKKDEMQLDAEVHRKYIFGGHVTPYMRRQVEPDGMEDMYEKVHAAIRTDPTAGKERKRFNLKKLTYEERKARLIEQLNALNACAGADDFDEDEDDE
ncbi:60S ribosomal protein, partial [Musa troglodytarum]